MPSYKQSEPKSGAFFVPPGTYELEITKAVEKTSQNGNPMISLTCEIQLGNGKIGPTVWDNLVFTPKAAWKIDQVIASIGRAIVPGENVEVDADDLVGMAGVAVIGEEPGAKNPSDKFNCIERWIFGDEKTEWQRTNRAKDFQSKPVPKPAPATTEEDDIPF
jgi:hypothetical protein